MLENIKLKLYLNKKQSLRYQMMIIFMEEHKKARQGKDHIGIYDGVDTLSFDDSSWKKIFQKFQKFTSKGYRKNFSEEDSNTDTFLGLFSSPNDYCSLRVFQASNNRYIQFTMKDLGYSYQYNGYCKSQDRLQKKANFFIFVTLIYYIISWVFKSPTITLNNNFFKKVFNFLYQDFKTIIIVLVALFLFKVFYVDEK